MLLQLAGQFQQGRWNVGDTILEAGAAPRHFYFIYYGQVAEMLPGEDEDGQPSEVTLGTLGADDFFGDDAILADSEMEVTLRAVTPVVLLFLPREVFLDVLENYPAVLRALTLVQDTRAKMRQPSYQRWLTEGETVFLIAKKHWLWFAVRMTGPVLALLAVIGLAVGVVLLTGGIAWPAVAVLLLLIAGWIGVLYVDWRDDTYLLTGSRVISDERLAIVHKVRAEAPLWTVRSVQIYQSSLGNIFDYGDLTMQTITGSVMFRDVPQPQEVEHMIKARIDRVRQEKRASDEEALRSAIRQGIGWEPPKTPDPPPNLAKARPSILPGPFVNRIVRGNTIIWRKHPVLLFGRTLRPTGLMLVVVVVWILRWQRWPSAIGPVDVLPVWDAIPLEFYLIFLLPILGLAGLWWLYLYLDWANDTYAIDNERIVDAERAPFLGEVQQRTAQIAGILNVQFEQPSLLARLLNYGSVIIETGGETGQLTFVDVYNPLDIQQEIFRRMEEHQRRKADDEAARRRNEIVGWLRAYAQVTQPPRPEKPYTDFPEEESGT